jgi:hypothetical protein
MMMMNNSSLQHHHPHSTNMATPCPWMGGGVNSKFGKVVDKNERMCWIWMSVRGSCHGPLYHVWLLMILLLLLLLLLLND